MLMKRLEEENEQPTVSMEFCFPQVLFVENVAKIDIDQFERKKFDSYLRSVQKVASPSRGEGEGRRSEKRHPFVKFFKVSLHFASRGAGARRQGKSMTFSFFLDAPLTQIYIHSIGVNLHNVLQLLGNIVV